MKAILVTTDFSVAANNAVEYAAAMANHYGTSLTLLHSYQSPVYYTADMPMSIIEDTEKQLKDDALTKMKKLKQQIESRYSKIHLNSLVENGLIGETSASISKAIQAEITVAATTGTGAIERMVLGSSAMQIVKHASNMVLLIPHHSKFKPIEKIIFATDLNQYHLMQYKQLEWLIDVDQTEISFLFVDASIHSDGESLDMRMSSLIKTYVDLPKKSGFVSTNPVVEDGINDFVEASHADLLIMVTESKVGLKSIFHKSHTKRISNKTPIPMLAVKTVDIPLPH